MPNVPGVAIPHVKPVNKIHLGTCAHDMPPNSLKSRPRRKCPLALCKLFSRKTIPVRCTPRACNRRVDGGIQNAPIFFRRFYLINNPI